MSKTAALNENGNQEGGAVAGPKSQPVQAHPRPTLTHAQQLYLFEQVGLVFFAAQAEGVEVLARFPGEAKPRKITLPPGNWLLVGVGELGGLEARGVGPIDNPYGA